MKRHPLLVLAALLVVSSLLATSAFGFFRAMTPRVTDPALTRAQAGHLDAEIRAGAGAHMQQLFPEGEFFLIALTGLAAARTTQQVGPEHSQSSIVTEALRRLDEPRVTARFGAIPELEHGTFYRGWRLMLLVEQARYAPGPHPGLQTEADAVAAALAASPTGVPASYPGQFWPCDAVVAMSAVVQARELAGRENPELAAWRAKVDALRDPATGLLPHQVKADGRAVFGPQGSSQSIIQAFWPAVDAQAGDDWQAFRTHFVGTRFGLVGVCEHVGCADGPDNIDSGPLVAGVSLSASAVGFAAARANGDLPLADVLSREAEFFGLRAPFGDAYLFGAVPVGDAFLAWARSGEPAPAQPHGGVRYDAPLLYVLAALPALLAAAIAALMVAGFRRRTPSGPPPPGRAAPGS